MELNFDFNNLVGYLCVFIRMTGMIAVNPIFARRNVPARVRTALVLGLTLIIAPTVETANIAALSSVALLGLLLLEFLVGFACSYCFVMFYYMLFFAGDFLDVEFGLSMARIFDPGSNIQMSISSNFLNFIFIMYFFTTDSHLLLIKLFSSSYDIVPLGGAVVTTALPAFFINLFGDAFSLVLRLALPFVCAMFVVEASMGVLMKLVPQIHIFVISIQLKILMGILLTFLFSAPMANFVDNYMQSMYQSMENVLHTFV